MHVFSPPFIQEGVSEHVGNISNFLGNDSTAGGSGNDDDDNRVNNGFDLQTFYGRGTRNASILLKLPSQGKRRELFIFLAQKD